MGESTSNKQNKWRCWRWIVPALVTLSGAINLANPHLNPRLHVAWFVLLPVAVIMCGYFLYANYRETRKHGSKASNST
jgi:cytochrome oxidase assembly protein ShyY1